MTDRRSDITSAEMVRDFMVDALRRELVGPDPGHPFIQWSGQDRELRGEEVLRPQDPPRYRYSCGVLFPNGVRYSGTSDASDDAGALDAFTEEVSAPEPEEADAQEDVAEEDPQPRDPESRRQERDQEPEVDAASLFLPSSMGVSFLIDDAATATILISWARYFPTAVPGYGGERRRSEAQADPRLWFRRPFSHDVILSPADLDQRRLRRTVTAPDHQPTLLLDVVSRPWSGNARLVTVTILNASGPDGEINEHCFYQCGFRVSVEQGRILPYPERPDGQADEEELSLRLLYRHRPVFAVGHGVAAGWSPGDGAHATAVWTESLPIYEQRPILPRENIEGVDLSMRRLAEADRDQVVSTGMSLAGAYRGWIAARRGDVDSDPSLSPRLRQTANRHLDECEACLSRLTGGIELLRSDDLVLEAFKLANVAMVQQREHYLLSSEAERRRSWVEGDGAARPSTAYAEPNYPYSTQWRPFQLAFVLMNLVSLNEPASPERELVDVIWFPTGGGKTEAYLGLAAFSILLRRLKEPRDAGNTVLMRYTLRLLTTQQFQRAASLICALELIRQRDAAALGDVPITIGLWLGSGVTPNRNDQAVEEYAKLTRADGDNKFVVLSCPWCGVDMGPQQYTGQVRVFGYERTRAPPQVRFRCEDHDCPFSGPAGLPLEVVDERIHAQPPTLVVGTVDKFAMLPWETKAASLFAFDNPNVSPPNLIIQDELHLISGPLGSMVGHYETVIDELCSRGTGRDRLRPKIIASTATIAHAAEQVSAVYNRQGVLFPPQGLRAGDLFFAIEREDLSGRMYVGVLATALPSHVTAQVRVIAALLQSVALLQPPWTDNPVPTAARDPYWTLMAYFNSLRELGRAATLIQADIREYLNAVWDRIGLTLVMDIEGEAGRRLRRFIDRPEELTSRVRSSDIPVVLQKLFSRLDSGEAIDLCLATNMIQVGLDVPRLSLMTIVGQPKTASEYIQASSRVGRGRDTPGLVVTNYNPFKPRDRSHFETFRQFHGSVYRHVEPTSVTPFSIPVSERAIHALAVTIARYSFPQLRDSPTSGLGADEIEHIVGIVMDRVRAVSPGEVVSAELILRRFLDDWNRVRPQYYGTFSLTIPGDVEPLLWPAGKPMDRTWTLARSTPSSMRNVDAECEARPVRAYSEPEAT